MYIFIYLLHPIFFLQILLRLSFKYRLKNEFLIIFLQICMVWHTKILKFTNWEALTLLYSRFIISITVQL